MTQTSESVVVRTNPHPISQARAQTIHNGGEINSLRDIHFKMSKF